MLSPYDYWQFWRNTEDGDVGRFLKFFTDMPLAEIARLEQLQGVELNDAKKILATEATTIVHGRAAAEAAAETARQTFEQGGFGSGLSELTVTREKLENGYSVAALAFEAGLTTSISAARRLIEGRGLRVNDVPVADVKATVSLVDIGDGAIKLSAGRKQHALVRPLGELRSHPLLPDSLRQSNRRNEPGDGE